MDHETLEESYRILARERSHEDARQTVTTNRMLVQSLVIINGAAATAVLAYCGAHNAAGPGAKPAALLTIVLYCLGVFTAIFAGLYVRRTTQEWSNYWELKSYSETDERDSMEGHRQLAIKSKRWSTGLLVCSEVFFLAACLCFAISLGQ